MDRTPRATYRLQIHKGFTLKDAAGVLPYLKTLGVSDVYLSPLMEATAGSAHGYDVCDFTKISAERGGEEAFMALDAVCRDLGLRLILDIVPNHMGIAGDNPFWFDVLRNGRESRYWRFFDLRVEEGGKIHLPILDGPLAERIADGTFARDLHPDYGPVLRIGERVLPLCGGEDAAADLNALLEAQHYTLVPWTEAFDRISYRRFFDITDLIGMRVEDAAVYAETHRGLLRLMQACPSIGGVRVDHIDGLADPAGYLARLRRDAGAVWVEKILCGDETLPPEWPVEGTTGYEFIRRLGRLMVDPEGFARIEDYWRRHIDPQTPDFESCVRRSKKDVLRSLFPSELARLVALSAPYGGKEHAEVFWRGMTVGLDVYRTYIADGTVSARDRAVIAAALEKAQDEPGFTQAARHFADILYAPKDKTQQDLITEWQQLTGPVMAKGIEDCAHYRYTPLAALNEVGCEPEVPADGRAEFFAWIAQAAHAHPHGMAATSTHDTKRSEDARHRLYALADRPEAWVRFYEDGREMAGAVRDGFACRPATEYFLFQAILAVWPHDGLIDDAFTDRIAAYMVKAAREARMETQWLKPDTAYEEGLEGYVRRLLRHGPFLSHVRAFAAPLAAAGAVNSISAAALKLLGPLLPDIYQGTEMWDFSLVDPDNRRPVDFGRAARLMESPVPANPRNWWGPDYKMHLLAKLLALRGACGGGPRRIAPLDVAGPDADHVVAWRFEGPKASVFAACVRFPGRLGVRTADLSLDLSADLTRPDGSRMALGPHFARSPLAVFLNDGQGNEFAPGAF